MTDIQTWQDRLGKTFGNEKGEIGHELVELDDAELGYGAWVADRFRGFMSISEAFLVFHFEMPDIVNEFVLKPLNGAGKGASHSYAVGVMRHATDFRSLRAARVLLFHGYPFEGATLVRPLFDAALVRSALMQGLTTIEAAEGIAGHKPGDPIDQEVVRRARIKEEKRIDSIMVGDQSGLSDQTRQELAEWEGLLHAEIHGARLSLAMGLDWLRGKAPLPFMPKPGDEDHAAMLLNRWVEVAWIVHRLMPTLQLPGFDFPQDWRDEWKVLDESFVPIVQALSSQLGKPIGDAMVDFVNTKFPFNAGSVCNI